MKKLISFFMILISPAFLFGEGTKELRPKEQYKGNLLLMNSYSLFGQFAAPSANQIKLRISDTTERIYYGLSNKNGNWTEETGQDNGPFVPGIPYRIVAPSGKVVYTSKMPEPLEEGHINNWTEAVSGPKELGNPNGYDALTLIPKETGDYIIEFNPLAVSADILNGSHRLNIHLFDFTVTDATKKVKLGRLHSQGWQISAEEFVNPFYGKVYPYDNGNAVYEVDFNGINPLVFITNFNSTGTKNTGNFTEDRKSRIGNFNKPEFEVFLNPPDEVLYPVTKKQISMKASIVKKDCNTTDYCLNYTTNVAGFLDIFLDFNKNGKYEPLAGEIFISKEVKTPGTVCVPWNGKNGKGQLVKGNESFNIISKFNFGPMNLPLYDAEHNKNGYKINIVRPSGSIQPLIFWDDTYIVDGSTIGDPLVNLEGCNPSASGCHKWQDRGSILNSSAHEKQETINTWWYSATIHDTILHTVPFDHHVKLSFHNQFLIGGDTTVCKGDTLNFYIYDNKKPHYDLVNFDYEWFYNNSSLGSNLKISKNGRITVV